MKSKLKTTLGRPTIRLLRATITKPMEAINKKKRSLLVEHKPLFEAPRSWWFSISTDRRPPPWTSFFNSLVEDPVVVDHSLCHGGLGFFIVSGRMFVITFGQSARILLNPDAIEPTFGYYVANRILDPSKVNNTESFRPEANSMRSKHQSPRGVSIDQFGHNPLRENLNVLAGTAADEKYGKRIQGGQALVAAQAINFPLLVERCRAYLEVFENKLGEFAPLYTNLLEDVHDKMLIEKLTTLFLTQLKTMDVADVTVGIPQFYDFEDVEGFRFSTGHGDFGFDLDIQFYLEHCRHPAGITVEILKQDMIESKSSDDGNPIPRWSLWSCLEAEVRLGDGVYLLHGGHWRKLPASVLAHINSEIDRCANSTIKLPSTWAKEKEGDFNARAASGAGITLMDKKIFKGKNYPSGFEFCDLLALDLGACIHVKRGTDSADLSHLFRQGVTSARMFLTELEFQQQMRVALRKSHNDIAVEKFLGRRDLTVVFAIVTSKTGKWSEVLPTFSKISLYDAIRDLRTTPFAVQLLRIEQKPGKATKTMIRKKSS